LLFLNTSFRKGVFMQIDDSKKNESGIECENKSIYEMFEFKSLKCFSDEEFLNKNNRKYRRVFQKQEVGFIHFEFSFFNLNYLKYDWEIEITYKFISENDKKIDEFSFKKEVSKNVPIMKASYGYGSKVKGGYWEKGMYKCEAWVGEKYIDSEIFFVEELGYAGNKGMPYIALEEIRLYHSEGTELFNNKTYLKCFPKETKSVNIELLARNLLHTSCPWTGEFIFLYKTELGELKEELRILEKFRQSEININLDISMHNNFNYSEGIYYIDVIFMEKLIAKVLFKIGDEEIKSTIEDHTKFFPDIKTYFNTQTNNGEVLNELNAMIGLKDVKNTVSNQLTYLRYLNLKQKSGVSKKEKINLNSLFIGNPGTGKTVVAKKLGRIYKDIGLLSSGHVYEAGRPELVAEYIGHTALKVKQAIEKARGGILFIDEAYSLAREKDNKRDFGAEVIEVLLKEMSDGPGDIAIIAAGYSEEMNIFLDSNPGLKSRFKHTFYFKDYTPDELLDIAEYCCKKKNLKLTKSAYAKLSKIIVKKWRNRDSTFGNARMVNELIDKAEMKLSLRIMNSVDKGIIGQILNKLDAKDFDMSESTEGKTSLVHLPVDKEGLEEALNELNSLTGLKNVKEEVNKLTKLVKYFKEEGKNPLTKFSLHSVFTGNPGTGKTSVARIMAKIFCALGILERGQLVECSRESLVSGYTGQTAIKTARMIEKSIGGVLFIDEAYSLTSSNDNDFGKEAIETLLKKMEDRRGEFIVIAAGYSEQMKYFLDSNPGLRSRFDRIIEFPDYTNLELIEIAYQLLKDNNISIYNDYDNLLFISSIIKLYEYKGRNFANAREIRKFIEQAVINQNVRISEIPAGERTEKDLKGMENEDFIKIVHDIEPPKKIGFS
jgi:SpoVK/Ycf46/Vps4 family AAA+-type ATPase